MYSGLAQAHPELYMYIPYPRERGPTTECRPTPHFGLNFLLRSSVYSKIICAHAGLHTGFFSGGGGGGGGGGDLTDDLRMYMRRCHAYILVNKSHNNAVITNDFFLLVYMSSYYHYLCCIYYMYIIMEFWGGGGGEIPVRPPLYATLPCIAALESAAQMHEMAGLYFE